MSVPVSRVQVMTFINKVAAIVHENTSLWSGACNKNMGNSFLLIWRIGEEKQLIEASRQDTRARAPSDSIVEGLILRTFTLLNHSITMQKYVGDDHRHAEQPACSDRG